MNRIAKDDDDDDDDDEKGGGGMDLNCTGDEDDIGNMSKIIHSRITIGIYSSEPVSFYLENATVTLSFTGKIRDHLDQI